LRGSTVPTVSRRGLHWLTGETRRAPVAHHKHNGKRLRACCWRNGVRLLMRTQSACRYRRFLVFASTNAIFISVRQPFLPH